MKRFLLTLCLFTAAIGFNSCENDREGNLFDVLVGRTWIGDMGIISLLDMPVESGITFNANGFGTDELYYYPENGGGRAAVFDIRWDIPDYDTITLDYGNQAAPRELRDVRIRRGVLTGELYIYDYGYYQPPIYYGYITLYMK